jgi:hypothetical protein
MKFATRFPRGFPEVGDVIKFTCTAKPIPGAMAVEQIIKKFRTPSTVEVLVIGRQFDEATGIHYLVTADDNFRHICNDDGWESQGSLLTTNRSSEEAIRGGQKFMEYRTRIHELEIVRKHH